MDQSSEGRFTDDKLILFHKETELQPEKEESNTMAVKLQLLSIQLVSNQYIICSVNTVLW